MTGNNAVRACPILVLLCGCSAFADAPTPQTSQPPSGQPPSVTLDYSYLTGDLIQATLTGSPGKPVTLVYGKELTVLADSVQGDIVHQLYDATGHVSATELDASLMAETLHFDGPHAQGTATKAVLHEKPYLIRAGKLTVSATDLNAVDARFTTAPPGTSPDYEIRAGTLSLYPERRLGIVRNGALYFFHTRVLTVPYFSFILPGANTGQAKAVTTPGVGFSQRDGFFVSATIARPGTHSLRYSVTLPTKRGIHAFLENNQTLIGRPRRPAAPSLPISKTHDYLGAIRALATAVRGPLPEGDPLLFHDFLPEPNPIPLFGNSPYRRLSLSEMIGYRLPQSGRRRDDLLVTTLPEIGLHGTLPLSALSDPAAQGDAAGFRRRLSRFVFYVTGDLDLGAYREDPTRVRERRVRGTVTLAAQPVLFLPNTVFVPSISMTMNRYTGSKPDYHYSTLSLGASHYFSPLSAISSVLIVSDVKGDSPFSFDVLDTPRELDTRIQMGNERLIVATLVRYDLVNRSVIDYKIAVAPGLRGLIPIFAYNFRSRSLSLGAEIEGITF